MAQQQLKLTRDQLGSFLNDSESIKQFEKLFAVVNTIAPDVANEILAEAAGANARAAQALGQIAEFAQDAETKAAQALALLQNLAGAVEGLQAAPPPREFKRARYGQFLNTATQTQGVTNVAAPVAFNTTDISVGVRLRSPSTSEIEVDTEGVYNFQVSMQFDSTGGANHDVWVWFRKNGTNIANSAMYLNIENNQSEMLQAFNLLVEMKALDYLEVMWEVGDIRVEMAAFAATGVHPAIPSIILTASNNIQGVQ